MKQLTYKEAYSSKSFVDFIQSLGKSESENEIILDTAIGHGVIRVHDIEPGLQLRLWDCQFIQDVVINRDIHLDKQDRTFTLVYYMTPESFRLEDCDDAPAFINSLWNTVMMSSDARFRVRLVGGKRLRCVSLNFSPAWFEEYILNDAAFNYHFIDRFVRATDPFIFFESYSHCEETLINSLYGREARLIGKFFYHSKAFNIVTEFFTKIADRRSLHSGPDLYYEQTMIDIEKKLIENLANVMHNAGKLAQEFGLSESTMKRYFKRRYGKNIYRYFLEKKMNLARELLEERKGTVTEVAYMVGYDRVSQFSNLFKRYYGTQPGIIRRAKLLQRIE